MSSIFRALADPTRRRILELLREGDLSAGELAAHFPVSRPTMSAHFAVLREAGLVATEKQGRTVLLGAALAQELELVQRAHARSAVVMGLCALVMVLGNVLPKLVSPLSTPGRDAVADRRAGWAISLTGLAALLTWWVAPDASALLLTSLVGFGGLALVGGSWLWRRVEAAGAEDQGRKLEPLSRHTLLSTRAAVGLLLHAVFWVFVIFLADATWGDVAARWVVVVFMVANGVLAATFGGVAWVRGARPTGP